MHDGMPYGRNQGQGQGHSREVYRQSPTGLIFNKPASVSKQQFLPRDAMHSALLTLSVCLSVCHNRVKTK